jgi:FdhD protein
MGHDMALRVGMTLIGRAASRRFVCYGGFERLRGFPAAVQRA